MKIIQKSNNPKNTEKNLKCLKKNLGRPQNSRVCRVSGNETFFLASSAHIRTIYN